MSDLGRLPTLVVESHRTPHRFFNPTHLTLAHVPSSSSSPSSPAAGVKATWQSRKARKGRYAPKATHVHSPSSPSGPGGGDEEREHGIKGEVRARLKHPGSRLKPGFNVDISFWVAVAFTFGSMVWVVNGFVVWFPILRPSLDTPAFTNTAAATAFIGGSVFLVGSYLMVVEALDRGRESQFGTALGQLLHYHRTHASGHSASALPTPSSKGQFQSPDEHSPSPDGLGKIGQEVKTVLGASGWIWWGKPLWHDLGYVAAIVQLFAATIFWISTLTGLPGVISGLLTGDGNKAIIDVFFWTPQGEYRGDLPARALRAGMCDRDPAHEYRNVSVAPWGENDETGWSEIRADSAVIGGSGFIISSLILMVEVQKKWYIPALTDIGWHIGFWNLVGAVGFTLCGALGYSSSSGTEYESALSTWWGSWAFLIGSGIQCAETIWREDTS